MTVDEVGISEGGKWEVSSDTKSDEIYGYSPEKDIWAPSQNCLRTQTALELCQKEKMSRKNNKLYRKE